MRGVTEGSRDLYTPTLLHAEGWEERETLSPLSLARAVSSLSLSRAQSPLSLSSAQRFAQRVKGREMGGGKGQGRARGESARDVAQACDQGLRGRFFFDVAMECNPNAVNPNA